MCVKKTLKNNNNIVHKKNGKTEIFEMCLLGVCANFYRRIRIKRLPNKRARALKYRRNYCTEQTQFRVFLLVCIVCCCPIFRLTAAK